VFCDGSRQLAEDNHRISKNLNEYVSSSKVYMNLRELVQNGNLKNFSKPDYLTIQHKEIKINESKQVISKFNGWVTIDSSMQLNRKNAPEVSK
jgi:3-methyladenine DNA glycosylase AlkD